MRRIRIFHNHQKSTQELEQTDFLVLGVHSFMGPLLEISHLNNISIFLDGPAAQYIDKVLWN